MNYMFYNATSFNQSLGSRWCNLEASMMQIFTLTACGETSCGIGPGECPM